VSPIVAVALVGVLIVASAFFVAAEFALVAVRRGVIEDRAEQGSRRARTALGLMRRVSFTLSGAQLGITLTALLIGFLTKGSLGRILEPAALAVGLSPNVAQAVAFGVAFVIFTIVTMVLAELVPKNLAIARPEGVVIALAEPVRAYTALFGPIIRLFDGAANLILRMFGVRPRDELLGGHSLDEIRRIIDASSTQGSIVGEQAAMLRGAVELFGGRRVSEIMVPRPDIVWLDRDDQLDALRGAARTTGHSRFPVRGDNDDDVVGSVHIKDFLRLTPRERATTSVGQVASPALVIPEGYELRRLLADLRRGKRTFAVVVDEYGSTAGIVTLEDLLEELVGEIEDEFDPESPAPRRAGAGRVAAPGSMRVDRFATLLGTGIPDGDYETAAGFVIFQLGRIPVAGEWFEHDGWRITVVSVEGARVADLLAERISTDVVG